MTERTHIHDEDLIRRIYAAASDPAAPDADCAGAARDLCRVPGDAEALAEWARQDAALRRLYGPVADEPVPDRLAAILRAAAAGYGEPPVRATFGAGRIAAAVAVLAVGLALGFGAGRLSAPVAQDNATTFADAALLAHRTFAPEVVHPVEVAASDEAHMTAWLSRRLGHILKAPAFRAEGFRLVGGRVLPDPNGAAAAMMYEDGTGARVTVYVAPDPGQSETALRLASGHGTEGFWWIDHGLGCAVVGDAPRDVLKALAGKAYEAIAGQVGADAKG